MRCVRRLAAWLCVLPILVLPLGAGAAARGGPDVIAAWSFDGREPGEDRTGQGHDLTPRGDSGFLAEAGRGGVLESHGGNADHDRAQGAVAKNEPELTPAGAFTVELSFAARPEMADFDTVFLFDKKYYHYAKDLPRANHDYGVHLRRAGGEHRFVAWLGYGEDSASYSSDAVRIEPDRWYRFAFVYDGAGTARFYLDGELVGREFHPGRGAVSPGPWDLVIGDRVGSIHAGFPGRIDDALLRNGVADEYRGGLALVRGAGRRVFVRMEPGARASVTLVNDTGKPLTRAVARVEGVGDRLRLPVADLAPEGTFAIDVPVDTGIRPDEYELRVRVTGSAGGRSRSAEEALRVRIVPRPPPSVFPVTMWGTGDIERLVKIGFTGDMVSLADYRRIYDAGEPTPARDEAGIARAVAVLDDHLLAGLRAVVTTHPGRWLTSGAPEEVRARFVRLDATGKPYGRVNTDASLPAARKFGYDVGASIARTFFDHPAIAGALVDSEVRDATAISYRPVGLAARKASGRPAVPAGVSRPWGVRYGAIEGFPADRVVPDDDPVLDFYRWFWKVGDGWNPFFTEVGRGLHSTGRDDVWTFFDPAVRAPSLWGSGGDLDAINQWTYTYPDPIKVGQAADELFAMAEGRPGQKVMKMTQIIWYRSRTAPAGSSEEEDRAEWERAEPDAKFITIAPDHLREAFWSMISRPVAGILYHGWQSLVPVEANRGSYRFTNGESARVLAELVRDVVRPLGPTLLEVPDAEPDVAILESFTSQMFAGRGTHGYGWSWEADLHLLFQWAHYQPRIVYEEGLLRGGLGPVRVLAMPYCDVLPETVVAFVRKWQADGGIVIGDEHLCPAIRPDVRLRAIPRDPDPEVAKKALQAAGAKLREKLSTAIRSTGECDDPDVVLRFRRRGTADYLFVLNDRRTFGDYVGRHGLVMEKGLPTRARILIHRKGGYVYDLVAHEVVPAKPGRGGIVIETELAPGGGRLFLISAREIRGVAVEAPVEVAPGAGADLVIRVTDPAGGDVDAVVPLEAAVADPSGRAAEGSGFYAAVGGRIAVHLDIASNDDPGPWTIRVTELASGRSAGAGFRVTKPR